MAITTLTVGFTARLQATVITIPDALDQTGRYKIENSIKPISGEASLYVAGTMTFGNPTAQTGAYNVHELIPAGGGQYVFQMGQRWQSSAFGLLFPDPDAYITTDLAAGDSFLTVLRIDQITGDYSFFADPDLSMLEGDNTPLWSGKGGFTGAFDNVQFRGGNDDNGVVSYTGFGVYTGADTPFGVPSLQLTITEIVSNVDDTVTLTWKSDPTPGTTYKVLFNPDLSAPKSEWPDENDSFATQGDTTTYTTNCSFAEDRMFFVVEKN